jgi:hypothetical protein
MKTVHQGNDIGRANCCRRYPFSFFFFTTIHENNSCTHYGDQKIVWKFEKYKTNYLTDPFSFFLFLRHEENQYGFCNIFLVQKPQPVGTILK